jgi:nuclear pore complex protein Nup107
MYTGALGQDAVERYAMFLVSLALSADIDERRLALTRAREQGLDMERIAIYTAERTIDNAFRVSGVENIFVVCAERRLYRFYQR